MKYNFIALRNEVSIPGSIGNTTIGRKVSLESLQEILEEKKLKPNTKMKIVLAFQKNEKDDEIKSVKQLHKYGVLVEITNTDNEKGKRIKINYLTLSKVEILNIEPKENTDYMVKAEVKVVNDTLTDEENIYKQLKKIFDEIKKLLHPSTWEPLTNAIIDFDFESPNKSKKMLIDIFMSTFMKIIPFSYEAKYAILAADNFNEKVKKISDAVNEMNESQKLDKEIDMLLKKGLDAQQTEFILREKIKVIRKKLGEDDAVEEKFNEDLNSEFGKVQYPEEVKKVIWAEQKKIKGMMTTSPEANISKTYLELVRLLPWRKVLLENMDIKVAQEVLSKKHYGLKDVKERIQEYIAILINKKNKIESSNKTNNLIVPNNNIHNEAADLSLFRNEKDEQNKVENPLNNMPILTLVGPPGTGKTSIVKSIADALGRKFIKISLGGVKDESEIRGHRRTYVGAMPGKIIQAIKKAGVSNPLILLDEIDKMSADHKGDPASAMLEVLDPEQNKHFQDHYLELEYDLSKVMFVATANYYEGIPEPLLDRVEIIELSSYTMLEKIEIAKTHLIDKVLGENLLDKQYYEISDEMIEFVIKSYTREAGVRGLKRVFDKLARKIVFKILNEEIKEEKFILDKKAIVDLLGIEKFSDDENSKEPEIGAVNGLAYTAYGGSTLSIEVTTTPSNKGEIKLTGQLKDVMQESAQIALTYVRANAEKFGIKDFDFENNQIHIHVPEGAVPKDGPSAGVTFTTAIISALSKKPVSHKVGMTGEITLRGKVLAIGGLKEKSLAAYKFGIKTIFIPKENEKNLIDIPEEVKKHVTYVPVTRYEEIFEKLFQDK